MQTPRVDVVMIGRTLDRSDEWFDQRFASQPSWAVITQLFLGIGWLRAATAKVAHRDWWSGQTITEFISEHEPASIGWYQPVLERLVIDFTSWWAAAILVAEIAIGLALVVSIRATAALTIGTILCLNFLLAGSTNPSVFYLVLQLALLLWILETAPSLLTARLLRAITIAGVVVAIVALPDVTTMRPQLVIDDPAAVLATWAICGSVAAAAGRRRIRRDLLRNTVSDLSAQPTPTTPRRRSSSLN